MLSVGLFTNLRSGKNLLDIKRYGQNLRLKKLRRIIRDRDYGRVYITGENYLEDLEGLVEQFCKDKPDVLAIDGGDGTISTVLSMLDKKLDDIPPVALTGGGTFNVLSKRLGIRKPYKYLTDIVDESSVEQLTLKSMHLMDVENDKAQHHLCFSVGAGAVVKFIEEVDKRKRLKFLNVGYVVAKLLLSAVHKGKYYSMFNEKIRMSINGEEDSWLFFMAQTVRSLGMPKILEPRILKKAEKSKERFQLLASTMDLSRLLAWLPLIYLNDPALKTTSFSPDRFINQQCKTVNIVSEEPFNYQFNGELYYGEELCTTRELYISRGRTIDFITP